jgi:hypothetical protein
VCDEGVGHGEEGVGVFWRGAGVDGIVDEVGEDGEEVGVEAVVEGVQGFGALDMINIRRHGRVSRTGGHRYGKLPLRLPELLDALVVWHDLFKGLAAHDPCSVGVVSRETAG